MRIKLYKIVDSWDMLTLKDNFRTKLEARRFIDKYWGGLESYSEYLVLSYFKTLD